MERLETIKNLRFSLRATIAGIVVTLASMYFWMSLAAILGIWSFRFDEIPTLGISFWSVAAFSWVISVAAGTFITVFSTRTESFWDGAIQSLITWSGAYLLFGGLTVSVAESSLNAILFTSPQVLMRIAFLGDALSLASAFLCGFSAVQWHRQAHRNAEVAEKRRMESQPAFHVPAHP